MGSESQKFMAVEGLYIWAQAAQEAIDGHRAAIDMLLDWERQSRLLAHRRMIYQVHLFLISANKFVEYLDWAKRLGMVTKDVMKIIEPFRKEIAGLRDQNEHVIEYYTGRGKKRDDWVYVGDGYTADGSSVVGTLIGGRLDYVAVCEAMSKIIEIVPMYHPQGER